MDLTVVVVSWNTRALALACVASVRESLAAAGSVRAELRLVDNGSLDGTAAAVRRAFPDVDVIALERNRGFAAGCNRGLRGAAGRHVLLLNSDARPLAGSIEACLALLDTEDDVGIVGPQLLHSDGRLQNSIHNLPTILSEVVPKSLLQRVARRRFPSKRSIGTSPLDVEAVTGAAIFARRRMIADIGPLPEEYFFYLEDTEWCRRARAAGWRVVHLPTAAVSHISGASSKRVDPAGSRIEYHRSLYRFFRANRGAGAAAVVVSMRVLKSGWYGLAFSLAAALSPVWRARWRTQCAVLRWHLRGCPAESGLAAAAAIARSR